jgi:hypothetical protein
MPFRLLRGREGKICGLMFLGREVNSAKFCDRCGVREAKVYCQAHCHYICATCLAGQEQTWLPCRLVPLGD